MCLRFVSAWKIRSTGEVERSFQETHISVLIAGDSTVLKGHCATTNIEATPLCIKEGARVLSAWKVRSTGEGVERPFQERAESERID